MSYNCPKCRDTKMHIYTRQTDAFSDEVTVYERCECDTSMSDYELQDIKGKLNSQVIYNDEEQNAALLEKLFTGKCQKTKMRLAAQYGIYGYEN